MILIADSGSTKTDWVLLNLSSGHRTYFEGFGLNPYFLDKNMVYSEVSRLFESIEINTVSKLFFYGAGCSTNKNKQIISKGLSLFFENAIIEVFHDMDGAARALCKTSEGIACILGTGSNACFYDGNSIAKNAVSLGFLIGDEGSGNSLGKKLIRSIYLNNAPNDLIQNFLKTFNLSLEDLLTELYKKPFPNRYLASFAKYMASNRKHPFVLELIHSSFDEFLQFVVEPLNPDKKIPIHFTGSIAWYFKSELEYVVNKQGYKLGIINQKIIEDLTEYHFYLAKEQ